MSVYPAQGPWGTAVNSQTTNEQAITTSGPSYILVEIAADNTTHAGNNHVDSVTASGLTFSKLAGGTCTDVGVCCEMWGAYSSGALSNVTITATVSSSSNIGWRIYSLAGVHPIVAAGATLGPGQMLGNLSCSFTGTVSGSMLFACSFEVYPYADYGTAVSPGSGSTVETQNYVAQFLRSTDAVSGGSQTISTSGFTQNQQQQYCGVEILSAVRRRRLHA
jgi:hypothetical protein